MRKIYILSLLMAVIVGVSVYMFADNLQRQTLEKIEANRSSVVVALQFIPANAEITGEMVALKELPGEAINPLAASKLDDVIGAITQYPIEPQEQVFTSRVKKREKLQKAVYLIFSSLVTARSRWGSTKYLV